MATKNYPTPLELVFAATKHILETNENYSRNYPEDTEVYDQDLLGATLEIIDPLHGQMRLTTATGQKWLITVEPEDA